MPSRRPSEKIEVVDLLQTTLDDDGEANKELTQISAVLNAGAFAVSNPRRNTSKSKYGGRCSNRPEMKNPIHLARIYRVILVLALALGGGWVGVYGIMTRLSLLKTEISTGKARELPPNDPMVINLPASAIPGSYEGKIEANRGLNAEIKWKDANQEPGITLENSISPGDYEELHSSNIETSPPTPQVWERNDISVQIGQAKAYIQPKILEGQYIDINLSAQILSIFEDGKLLDSYFVSTGKQGMETPRGMHAIANKCPRAWSEKYGVFMPYWMAITPGGSFGIHELPERPDGDKDGANDLGNPVSHGCVRLGIGPAERVYNWAEIGTPVVVY